MTSTTRPARVFIVDDSKLIQHVLAEMLSELPSVEIVGTAETADLAIEGIRAAKPDCVFLDLQLKIGSGLAVLQAIHPESPSLVFVVMTNHEGSTYRQACMAAGASHFLDKTNELGKIKYAIDGLDLSPIAGG